MTVDASADPQLIARLRTGDESALETLYSRYGGLVYALALRIVGDRELAREILQDTFVRVWDGVASYDPARGHLAAWLMGIARNGAIDLLRSRPHQARLREHERLTPAAEEITSTSPANEIVLLRRAVVTALGGLSASQRRAVELAYYAGLTQAEIAQETGEPLGTVKSRIRDAMNRLRGLLGPLLEPKGSSTS